MDRADVLGIMAVLKAAYPNYYKGMSRADAESVVGLWVDMFSEDNPAQVAAAVKALITTDEKGFPPHIGAVKAKLRQLTAAPQATPMEAWGLVLKAIKRSAYNAREEFEKLPPALRRLVGSPSQLRDWSLMDEETVQSVVASNFRNSYQIVAEREAEYQALPADVKQMLSSVSGRFALNGGESP